MAYRKDFWGKTFNVKAFSFFVGFEFICEPMFCKEYTRKVVYHCGVNKSVFSKNKKLVILTACFLIYKSGYK